MRRWLVLTFASLATLVAAAPAGASFHLMGIREVAPNPGGANSAYIELQMYSSGQNFVTGHSVTFYTASGSLLASYTLPGNVPNGGNQRTILIGDTAAAGSPDFVDSTLGDAVQTYGPGGAACWDTLDCVSWGAFTGAGSLPSPPGSPAPAIPDGSALQRSIARGCATLFESGDDTNDSAADFALVAPAPRNNSTAPTELECSGGGGGGSDTDPPQTKITKGPDKKADSDKAKFKFTADENGSGFQCALDEGKFKKCGSPKKYKHLEPGKHKFFVRAIDKSGNVDRSPAKYRWKVLGD